MLFQIVVVVVWYFIKLLQKIPCDSNSIIERFKTRMINKLEWGAFIGIFLLFDIQLIIYATLNINIPVTSHYVFLTSLVLSWTYYFMVPAMALFLIYFTQDKK